MERNMDIYKTEKYKKLGGFLLFFRIRFSLGVVFIFIGIISLMNVSVSYISGYFIYLCISDLYLMIYCILSFRYIASGRNEKSLDILLNLSYITLFIVVATFFITLFMGEGFYSTGISILNFISTIIWITYLTKSKRVRVFFNIPPENEEEQEEI